MSEKFEGYSVPTLRDDAEPIPNGSSVDIATLQCTNSICIDVTDCHSCICFLDNIEAYKKYKESKNV